MFIDFIIDFVVILLVYTVTCYIWRRKLRKTEAALLREKRESGYYFGREIRAENRSHKLEESLDSRLWYIAQLTKSLSDANDQIEQMKEQLGGLRKNGKV